MAPPHSCRRFGHHAQTTLECRCLFYISLNNNNLHVFAQIKGLLPPITVVGKKNAKKICSNSWAYLNSNSPMNMVVVFTMESQVWLKNT
jgi:hypothetical protein